jgi:hypothetical protein
MIQRGDPDYGREHGRSEHEPEHDGGVATEKHGPPATGGRMTPVQRRPQRSSPDLLRQLRDDLVLLLRQEVALARVETSEKVSRMVRNVIYIAVGGFIGYAGFVFLLLAAVFGVVYGLRAGGVAVEHALWIAPLIVGGIVALLGYVFIQKGISTLKRESPMPERTMRTLNEDKEWIKEKVSP